MFKAMTLNLNLRNDKHGAWEARKQRIVAAISAASPDVVALQAVDAPTGGVDQATELVRELPDFQEVWYQPAMRGSGGSRGSAIISRVPCIDRAYQTLTRLPDVEDTDRRVLLRARVEGPAGGLDLYNGHFSWVARQGVRNREESVPFVAGSRGPALLLGDFNAAPGSTVMQGWAAAGWQDMWASLRPDDAGYTFEADAPEQRIDYVLANRAAAELVRTVETVGLAGGGPPRLSDHLGLVVSLSS